MLQCKSSMKPWMKRGLFAMNLPSFTIRHSNMDDLCGCTNHPRNVRLVWRSNLKIRDEIFTLYDIIHMFHGGKSLSRVNFCGALIWGEDPKKGNSLRITSRGFGRWRSWRGRKPRLKRVVVTKVLLVEEIPNNNHRLDGAKKTLYNNWINYLSLNWWVDPGFLVAINSSTWNNWGWKKNCQYWVHGPSPIVVEQ